MRLWIYGKKGLNIGDISIQRIYLCRAKQRLSIIKHINIFISFVLVIMLFVGCQTTEKTLQKDSGNLAKTKITEDKYITLTNTYVADQAGENNEMMVMDVIKYDLSNGTISKIASLPYTSQYPLTMYDAEEEKVYYTANADDGKGDELFVMNCNTDESVQLTKYFFAINNIYPIKNGIFVAGVKRHEELVRPYFYDKKTKKVNAILLPEDVNITCTHYNSINQELFVVGYREQDDRKALEEQGESGDVQGITHTIYKFEDNKFKQIYTKKNCYIKSIATCEDSLFIKWGASYFSEHMKLSTVYPGKKTEESFQFPKSEMENLVDNALVYVDEDEIFYLRNFEKKGKGESVDQLCCYSRRDKNIKVLFDTQTESAINNAQFIVKR